MAAPVKMTFIGTVQPWGNSLGLRITRPMSELSNIRRGDTVSVEITDSGMVITRQATLDQPKLPYTEAQLIAGMTPYLAHADELPTLLAHEVGE